MNHWQEIRKVVVVGLGVTGLSVVRYLEKYHPDINIRVMDTREDPPGLEHLPPGVECYSGGWCANWLEHTDLIVVNPGVSLSTPELQSACQKGVRIVGDIELFAWHVTQPVIAITGSNGKSTVTDLTGKMAESAGLKVGVGGNIGVPALDLIDDSVELYVLELSSFQLETTSHLAVKAAAFLNLSEDHMDRYPDMEGYRQAKVRIFSHAESIVVNADDPATFPVDYQGTQVRFSLSQPAEFSVQTIDGSEYLMAMGKPVMQTRELHLVGRHNIANVLTVFALLHLAEIDFTSCLDTLKSYMGLTHRCQLVAQRRGIKWVNDSKATNVASTLAALSGLQFEGRLYLLVGGAGKGADFSPLAPVLSSLNLKLCCFGQDGGQFMSLHPSARLYSTMDEVIQNIAPELESGDIVMLSPACASFDQYKNFMARGDAFAGLAKRYA